jgi:hypothetical protein
LQVCSWNIVEVYGAPSSPSLLAFESLRNLGPLKVGTI